MHMKRIIMMVLVLFTVCFGTMISHAVSLQDLQTKPWIRVTNADAKGAVKYLNLKSYYKYPNGDYFIQDALFMPNQNVITVGGKIINKDFTRNTIVSLHIYNLDGTLFNAIPNFNEVQPLTNNEKAFYTQVFKLYERKKN